MLCFKKLVEGVGSFELRDSKITVKCLIDGMSVRSMTDRICHTLYTSNGLRLRDKRRC